MNKMLSKEMKEKYTIRMTENLPLLRHRLGLSQTELGQIIGVSRQAISTFENASRNMSWQHFTSLLFVFNENPKTRELIRLLNIYPSELIDFFR